MKLSRRNAMKSLAALASMPVTLFGRAKGGEPSTPEIGPAQQPEKRRVIKGGAFRRQVVDFRGSVAVRCVLQECIVLTDDDSLMVKCNLYECKSRQLDGSLSYNVLMNGHWLDNTIVGGNTFVSNAEDFAISGDAKPFGFIGNNTIRDVHGDGIVTSDGKSAGFNQKQKAGAHACT